MTEHFNNDHEAILQIDVINPKIVLMQLKLTRTKIGNNKLFFDLFVDELMTIIKQKFESEYESNEWIDSSGVDVDQTNGLTDDQTCVGIQRSTEQNISQVT